VHCPGHTAPLALVEYENHEKKYMFAPESLYVNQNVFSGVSAEPKVGNTLPLKNIPTGTDVFNIENRPADGGNFCRSSGTSAKIVAKTKDTVTIKFPSKKVKVLDSRCRASIGIVSGGGRKEKPFIKAGKRHFAMKARNKLYPQTSGVAMNAIDHPFGSGRGRHIGKAKIAPRFAPAGRNVGLLKARRTGRRKRK
jgi:large subunit ribosomal protein L2